MADLPLALESAIRSPAAREASPPGLDLETAFLAAIDPDGKITAALEALGPIAGRDVVVVDAGAGYRACQLHAAGARVTAVSRPDGAAIDAPPQCLDAPLRVVAGSPEATGLPDEFADAVVSFWSAFLGPDPAQIQEAERILRPGGRLLIVHDYGRDDVCDLWRDEFARQVEWSRRNGPFLGSGFRVRVIHSRWTFESLERAATLLGAAFGPTGESVAASLKRPRMEYNVAVFHRTREVVPLGLSLAGSVAS